MVEQKTLTGSTVKADKKFKELGNILASIFFTPVNTKLSYDDATASTSLKDRAIEERMIRLMEVAKEDLKPKEMEKKVLKLTDAEKLAILSNMSLKAPLSRDYFEEMQRLFFRVKGEKAYRMVFGDEDPRPVPEYIDLWKGR